MDTYGTLKPGDRLANQIGGGFAWKDGQVRGGGTEVAGARFRVKYGEGDLFAVPLDGGGYGTVLVSRRARSLLALGYFYGPRRPRTPLAAELVGLEPSSAVWVALFSALGIRDGDWPRIGHLDGWDRARWPVPGFRAGSLLLADQPIRIDLDDNDISLEVGRRLVSREEWGSLAEDDGVNGYRAAEIVLSKKLARGEDVPAPVPAAAAPNLDATPRSNPAPATDDGGDTAINGDQLLIDLVITGAWGSLAERSTLEQLEERLDEQLGELGEVDGNEVGAGRWRIFINTPDRGRALSAVERILDATGIAWSASS
jgi:hypothetical protein